MISCPYRSIPNVLGVLPKRDEDYWKENKSFNIKNYNSHCSYCGSLNPEYFLEILEKGGEIVPTDKPYKAYLKYKNQETKFYFAHLDPIQIAKYISLAERNKLKFGYPGFFYKAPFFLILENTTPFAFGSVIRLEEKVEEGNRIKLIKPIYKALVNKIILNPNFINEINPHVWEEIIAATYDKEGFDEVIITPKSGDFGIDVIARKNGLGTIKFIDQVKKYNSNHIVTAEEVRALLFVLHADEEASNVVLTTTSDFAPKLGEDKYIKHYIDNGLTLINREKLINKIIS